MRHIEKALGLMDKAPAQDFISFTNLEDVKGIAPKVTFELQSDPVNEVGVNGCQATDILEFVKCLFQSLNGAIPNRETSITITKLEEAIHWQNHRLKDRTKRGVEGTMEK